MTCYLATRPAPKTFNQVATEILEDNAENRRLFRRDFGTGAHEACDVAYACVEATMLCPHGDSALVRALVFVADVSLDGQEVR